MNQKLTIPNQTGELLDALLQGSGSNGTIIFVHGFGTNKHETEGLFDDIADSLNPNYATLRFDFSGYGKSQGKQASANYKKQAADLNSVLRYCDQQRLPRPYIIIAVSAGCYVTAIAAPKNIHKSIFLSVPDQTTDTVINTMRNLVIKRGEKFNPTGITKFPRSTGDIQVVGPTFWQVLESINPLKLIRKFSSSTQLLLIHAQQDELIGAKDVSEYKQISAATYLEIPGNHAFVSPSDRKTLIQHIKEFLSI